MGYVIKIKTYLELHIQLYVKPMFKNVYALCLRDQPKNLVDCMYDYVIQCRKAGDLVPVEVKFTKAEKPKIKELAEEMFEVLNEIT